MLRLTRCFRAAAARCHYDVLGVAPTATDEEIKRTFRRLAKETHPDVAQSSDAKRKFAELVDAYRGLRDPKKRAQYDRERTAGRGPGAQAGYGGPRAQASYGAGGWSHEEMYRYASQQAGGSGRAAAAGGVDEGDPVQQSKTTAALLLFFGGAFLLVLRAGNDEAGKADPDPYPSRRPQHLQRAQATAASASPAVSLNAGGNAMQGARDAVVVAATSAAAAPAVPASIVGSGSLGGAEELVRAYYNPYAERWHRVPDGYEPPAAMDLTAWHKKRTDPVEWSRLLAEGKLSEIMPRSGLR
eukprot:TRINITY_DN29369_c0_g1_i1.p1 TRINITY_DN29369_c0_g1~~TRINITY_DN29369_c0_g1_i1.p1  ORF type:complete len:299 (-),score=64.37 TRINITY_DN29369_c0_g1_i1:51-947(-)